MTDWIFATIDLLGPVGVGLLIALETLVPPIPSELILPLAGFRARAGAMHPLLVWVAATVGAVSGSLVLYWLGARLGYERLHRLAGKRWFVLASRRDLERGHRLFARHGSWFVAGSRCVPVLRSLVSIPAGVERMPLRRFVTLTAAGSGVWNALFIGAGWLLADRWREIDRYTAPAGTAVAVLLGAGVLVLVVRKVRQAE
ncbi:DedA family protein [Dactylosporangium sp. AC04546]|uniref:DedA family protein n=1 Tax=Dactylosporangium sp. AC04546 TaxID=2862460 RepID=UPI001EDFEBD4|nr:DedA family protein [Dactylosporangium sp. AC04546]WVK87500.1 DedA family protein [Dactylosporangium sp. AC04546]